jgi:hypothetical protein
MSASRPVLTLCHAPRGMHKRSPAVTPCAIVLITTVPEPASMKSTVSASLCRWVWEYLSRSTRTRSTATIDARAVARVSCVITGCEF